MVKVKAIHLLAINGILWTAIGTKIAAIFLPSLPSLFSRPSRSSHSSN